MLSAFYDMELHQRTGGGEVEVEEERVGRIWYRSAWLRESGCVREEWEERGQKSEGGGAEGE